MKTWTTGFLLACTCMAGSASANRLVDFANTQLLPEEFQIGVTDDGFVVNHPGRGLTTTILPTVNKVTNNPGCYLACYTKESKQAAYKLTSSVSVVGQLRSEGEYGKNPLGPRICDPKGFEGKDISAEPSFMNACQEAFPEACSEETSCWAGGDTGGWFGL